MLNIYGKEYANGISPDKPARNLVLLRKLAYSNLLKILQSKQEIFQIKKSDIYHISSQNMNCGTR